MDPYKETHNTWNTIAELYEKYFMELDLYNDTYRSFCAKIPQTNPEILEIGCGPGNITKHVLKNRPDFKLVGIDVSKNMITLAQKNNPNATFKVMDCRYIDTFTNLFNGIMVGFCLPYLSKNDGAIFIQNCSNLLSKKGILYLSFIESDMHYSKYTTGINGEGMLFHYYALNDLKKIFINNQLQITQTTHKNYTTKDGIIEIHTILILEKQ